MAWATGTRHRYRVEGPSMEPTLLDGEFVLVELGRIAGVGELVLATVPGRHHLDVVKRVGRMMADGRFWLTSDNHERGTDSRRWGAVDPAMIQGTVTLNLSRPFTDSSTPRLGSHRGLLRWLRR
ncbi:MAG: S26 family signal peptidase [Actinomycetia bacterium]|nr:S26 family signal peptidase [Actinomycetes bacterium]